MYRTAPVDVAGLGDDLEARLGLEQQPQAGADDRVVVGEDDADLVGDGAVGLRFVGHSLGTIRAAPGTPPPCQVPAGTYVVLRSPVAWIPQRVVWDGY